MRARRLFSAHLNEQSYSRIAEALRERLIGKEYAVTTVRTVIGQPQLCSVDMRRGHLVCDWCDGTTDPIKARTDVIEGTWISFCDDGYSYCFGGSSKPGPRFCFRDQFISIHFMATDPETAITYTFMPIGSVTNDVVDQADRLAAGLDGLIDGEDDGVSKVLTPARDFLAGLDKLIDA